MSRAGNKPAYSKKIPQKERGRSVFKTPDLNSREQFRQSAGNLKDQIFNHLDAASRSDGGGETPKGNYFSN